MTKKARRYRPTDHWTDQQTDRVGHRVACMRLRRVVEQILQLLKISESPIGYNGQIPVARSMDRITKENAEVIGRRKKIIFLRL